MKRLLSIEWNKLFYSKGTRVFIILYFVMIILMGLILPNIKPNINGQNVDFIKFGALEFPVIWHNIAWLVGFGKYFLAIIVINNIANEYSFGTFKQNIIDGLSKTEFFGTKLLMNFVLILFSTFLVGAIVFGLGASFNEKNDFLNGIEFWFAYFVEIFAYVAFAMFLTFLLKKSTFAILSLIVLTIGETILKYTELFIHSSKTGKIPDKSSIILNYLPLNSNSEIVGYPSMSLTKLMTTGKLFDVSNVQWEYLAINIFYIILFLGLSLFIIKKRDL